MTDIGKELEHIKCILNVLYTKVERLENQISYCVDALIDLRGDEEDDEPLSQHDIEEFGNDDDGDAAPPPYDSSSSSTTKQV